MLDVLEVVGVGTDGKLRHGDDEGRDTEGAVCPVFLAKSYIWATTVSKSPS